AERRAQDILRFESQNPRALLVLGAARRRRGNFLAARDLLEPLARSQPDLAYAHFELGLAQAALGFPEAAIGSLRRAVTLKPGMAEAWRALGDQAAELYRQRKAPEAMAEAERLLADHPGDSGYRALVAACVALVGDYGRAITIYEELLVEHPGHVSMWLSLGHARRAAGRREEAIGAYRRAIALSPGCGEAYWSLANLKTFAFSAGETRSMRDRLKRPDLAEDDRLHLNYALGKALEDAGDPAASFSHYARGATLQRRQAPYDPEETTAQIRRSKALFTQAFFAERAGAGSRSTAPIFIVGLPRSGSTLIEQILASHSAVEGAGELPEIVAIARTLGQAGPGGDPLDYPAAAAGLTAADLAALGDRYIERARIHRRLARPHFVDKAPINFHHVGLIHLILPEAKIIDARREPMAGGFSVFKQLFARGHAFSYDLADIGRYYRDYAELMAHFDAVLPGRIHRVLHEDLLNDPEGEIRRLLDHCGLPFEAACPRFHENDRAIRTASSEQVRRPISHASRDQWRRYEAWLGPLKAALGETAPV
nr:sulfotransferase [Caulobacteraceae bacterium]